MKFSTESITRWKSRCQFLLITIPIVGLALFANPAQAQVCNAISAVAFGDATSLPVIVGDTYEARVSIAASNITTNAGTGTAGDVGISVIRYELDCSGGGGLFCSDDTNTVTYQGPATITDTTCLDAGNAPVTFAVTQNSQQLVLTASSTVVLEGTTAAFPASNESCFVDLLISIEALIGNTLVVQAGGYSNNDPPNDAFCDTNDDGIFGNSNDIASGAQNTLQISPITCEPELDKYVCVDLDGDDITDQCFGEDEVGGAGATIAGKDVEWFISYSNEGTGTLSECVLSDTVFEEGLPDVINGGVLLAGQGASDVPIGGPVECSEFVENTATISCGVCGIQENTYEASDTVTVDCPTCEVTIDKQATCEDIEPIVWIDETGVDDDADDSFTRACIGWNGDEEVGFKYTVTNTGDLDVDNCVVTDTNGAPGTAAFDNVEVSGDSETQTFDELLCDDYEGDGTGLVNCDCVPLIDGVDLDEALVLSGSISGFGSGEEICQASASDAAGIICQTASVNISKVCGSESNGQPVGDIHPVVITVWNNGEAALENCMVTDTLDPGGTDTDLPIVCVGEDGEGKFDLASGDEVECTYDIDPALTEETLNSASVVCDIVGSKKTTSDDTTDLCVPGGDGCFTRTPGYWGTHPESTEWALDGGLVSCGVLIDNVDDKTQGSAIEDMCSIGKDQKAAQTTNTQLNLERHCMAAALNISATALQEGGSCESEYPGISEGLAYCCGYGLGVGEESVCNTDDAIIKADVEYCIGFVGGFNELSDGNELDEMDLCPDNLFTGFEAPCSADSSVCRASKGNNWVNDGRDREVVCKGKNCP